MPLAEDLVVELLPAQRDTHVSYKRAVVSERAIARHDAAIIVCERERSVELISQLPFAPTWRRLYEEGRRRGVVSHLSARLTEAATPIVIAFAKNEASSFERLTLAARAWKELAAPASSRVLLGTLGMDAAQIDAVFESLVAAALAATAPMPSAKSSNAGSKAPIRWRLPRARRPLSSSISRR